MFFVGTGPEAGNYNRPVAGYDKWRRRTWEGEGEKEEEKKEKNREREE